MDFEKFLTEPFVKIILSNKKDKSYAYNKAVVEPVILKNKSVWQITSYTNKQAFHENLPDLKSVQDRIKNLFGNHYKQLNILGITQDTEIKLSKRDKVMESHHNHPPKQTDSKTHNRTKNYLIAENQKIPALIDMGVMTKEGKIIHAQMDKFRQINRFLEIIDDTLKTWKKKEITVVDFGCGKSYLTFLTYYYLTKIKGLNAHVIGLDLKEEVIEKCNIVAEKYGYKNLHFEIGNIAGYRPKTNVDMVISLHACDTATDYALYNAVQWNVPIILSVPCCQHEVNAQMKNVWPLITKYGIFKERFSALLTDAMRADLLESCGYSVQILEFIDFAHTPKNLLIRAIKTGKKSGAEQTQKACDQFKIAPTLPKLLKK
ncbi:MAG: SAM-dependent methyltransferase [Alphaproteobacteria bacterium]|nr:SAM-dependent methyltransferase [Alphaproteobacteria bacterium]